MIHPKLHHQESWAIHGHGVADYAGYDPPLYPAAPRVALVIGTYSSAPYIHLHLEARRRFYPALPTLVHDDGSDSGPELKTLCDRYGVEFEQLTPRLGPNEGDVGAFVGGLRWAADRGYDILVKMSRRFLPLEDWVTDLADLAVESQYPTFTSWTETYGYGFRTECTGMSVREWVGGHRLMHKMAADLEPRQPLGLIEGYVHNLARRAATTLCPAAHKYRRKVTPMPPGRDGYAVWRWMGADRHVRYPQFLWHDCHDEGCYHEIAQRWGLPYDRRAFETRD